MGGVISRPRVLVLEQEPGHPFDQPALVGYRPGACRPKGTGQGQRPVPTKQGALAVTAKVWTPITSAAQCPERQRAAQTP